MMPFSLKSQTSLSRDFMLMSLVMIFVLFLASIWIAYDAFEDHSHRTVKNLESEAARIDRALIIEIRNASYLLESMGRQISQFGPDKHANISKLLRSFNHMDSKNDVFSWVDDKQRVTISSRDGIRKKAVDVSDRDYVKKALAEPWQIQIGRPILGRVSSRWVLPISMGLTDYSGKHIGSLLISLDIQSLTKDMQMEVNKAGLNFAILSKTLTALTEVYTNDGAVNTLLPVDKLNGIDFDAKPEGVISRARLFNDKSFFTIYSMSAKYPYVILLSYNGAMSTEEISRLLWPRLFQVCMIAVFLVGLLWMVKTRIIRPVLALSEITADVTRGKAFRQLPEGAPGEIEFLSEQIEKLTLFIKERERVEEELLIKNTYLKRVKETAQLVNRARTQFLESLASELDKPVDAIREASEAMKDQHFGPMGNETYLRNAFDVFKSSNELKQMIADILSVSALEQGILILHEKAVNVSFCIHRAIRHFHDQPQYRHIDVKMRVDEHMPKLIIDEDRFNQILINMLIGAALQLAPGSSMVLESLVEKNDAGHDDYVFMLKYNILKIAPNSDLEKLRRLQLVSDKGNASPVFIRSEGINLALTRMLVSLHQGSMEIQVSQNNVCRIFIKFPEKRILQGERIRKVV